MMKITLSRNRSVIVLLCMIAFLSITAKAVTYNATVASDGTGNYTTVQAALNAAPSNSSTRWVIYIKNGTYKEVVTVASAKANITLLGQSVDGVKLTYNNANITINPATGTAYGTGGSASFFLQGSGFYAENITFENSYGVGNQAVTINISGDKSVFNNCKFLGRQDTWYGSNCRTYLKNCYIEGTTDFIFGSATAFFDGCTLYSYGGSALTAANTASYITYGLVFKNCTITGASGVSTLLGRSWGGYAATAFIGCSMTSVISAAGWSDWGNTANDATTRYCEYGNTGTGASTSGRVSWCHLLTSTQAANYTYLNIMKTTYSSSPVTDNWDPTAVLSSVSPISSGAVYSVIAKHSGKGLDVQDVSTASGGNIQQYTYSGAANQKFIIRQVDGEYYSIVNVNSGKGLDVASGSTADGANIQQWSYNGQSNQQFKFVSTGDGYYQIVNRNSGKCLDVTSKSTSNGANVQQYTCGTGTNQRWLLTMVAAKSSVKSMAVTEVSQTVGVSLTIDGKQNLQFNEFDATEDLMVRIFDVRGKLVYQKSFTGESAANLQPTLTNGIYVVSVKSAKTSATRKICF